jgi:murein DD-endopeptidase MepM/ murein hydrolase activator NlpD
MSWPVSVAGAVITEPAAKAIGGGLETRPMRSSIHRVMHHNAEYELPPGAPRNGHGYMVLQWPLPATGVNSLYGERADPLDGLERHHNGVDLEASLGAVVGAAADGVVIWAGWNAGHGRQVIIEHAGGFRTGYSHLSQLLTYLGSSIRTGDPVGLVGNSGRSTGPHLHFEVTRDDLYVDPLDVLGVPQPTD